MATKTQVNAFIQMIGPIIISVCNSKSRKVLPSVCIAQACCESGYGTNQRMINANAVFGIKVGTNKVKFGTAWKNDKYYDTKTKECYDGKNMVTIKDKFRAYDSIKDSVEDYYDMLASCSRYSKCINVTDAKTCISAIKNGGYATDPNYVSKIMNIINTNNLTRFDTCMKGGTTNISSGTATAVGNAAPDKKVSHEVGESIRVSSYYRTSVDDTSKAIIRNNTGIIIRVIPGAKNPYCFANPKNRVAIGWCNDGDIRESSKNNSTKTHTVKSGDTLGAISKKYGTTVDSIVINNKGKYPSIKANFIRVGWVLEV